MNKTHVTLIATLLTMAVAAPAAAQKNPWYIGAKIGQMDIDAGGFDEATNFGFVLGYHLLADKHGSLSLEGEYTNSLKDGDIAGGGDWDVETLAAYAAYRTARAPGDVFLKAKAGFADAEVSGFADDSGFSFGAGVGWALSKKADIEFEYTVIEDDLNFLSVGFTTHF